MSYVILNRGLTKCVIVVENVFEVSFLPTTTPNTALVVVRYGGDDEIDIDEAYSRGINTITIRGKCEAPKVEVLVPRNAEFKTSGITGDINIDPTLL